MTAFPSPDRLNRLMSFLRLDENNLELLKETIHEAFACGQWEYARELIESGLKRAPADAGLLGVVGILSLRDLRYGDAIDALLAARTQGLDSPSLRYDIAYAHFMLRQHRQTLEALDFPAMARTVPASLVLRARCLHHLGRIDEAIASCKEQLMLHPQGAETLGLLALLLQERGRAGEARMLAEAALEMDSLQLEAQLALASIQADAHQHEAAQASFRALVQSHPTCGRGWLGLALADMMQMQYDAARVSIELAACHIPEHIGTWHVLAWLHILGGDAAAAKAAFEHALTLDRNFAETHGGLAVVAALQGREIEAQQIVRRALGLDPQSLAVQYARLLLLQALGQHDKAQAVVNDFLAREVPHRGMLYRDLLAQQMSRMNFIDRAGKTLH